MVGARLAVELVLVAQADNPPQAASITGRTKTLNCRKPRAFPLQILTDPYSRSPFWATAWQESGVAVFGLLITSAQMGGRSNHVLVLFRPEMS